MKNTTSLLAYPKLLEEIYRLISQKETGTIFITSNDGHLIRIVLNNGHITSLIYDTKHRGFDAIPLIQKLTFGRLQFAEGIFETDQEVPLPDTENLLSLLRGEEVTDVKTGISLPTSSHFDNRIEYIKKKLATYIGPFAVIVCDEYLEKAGPINTIDNLMQMIDQIAKEIDNLNEEQVFKKECKQKIMEG